MKTVTDVLVELMPLYDGVVDGIVRLGDEVGLRITGPDGTHYQLWLKDFKVCEDTDRKRFAETIFQSGNYKKALQDTLQPFHQNSSQQKNSWGF